MGYKRLKTLILGLAAGLLLSGCTLIPFEDPAAQKQKALEAAVYAEPTPPDAQAALGDDRLFHRELKTQAGVLLAVYTARMPRFEAEGEHAAVFEAVDAYYGVEFDTCSQESEAFFQMVQRFYGAEWEQVGQVEGLFTVDYSYAFLDPPAKYFCIQKTYTYTTPKGAVSTRPYPDVFLAENGWRLSFEGLFGHAADEAAGRVLAGIAGWAEKNKVPHEKLDGLEAAVFTEYYAIDGQDLVFYAEPFLLSTNDAKAYTIRLPLSGLSDLIND